MNNKETAAHLREWVKTIYDIFEWPTGGCGYKQHMKFVEHRNKNWAGGDWNEFVLDYADILECFKDEPSDGRRV